MFMYKTLEISIYFGDAQESISLEEIDNQQKTQALTSIAQKMNVDQIVFLKQEHGVQGKIIELGDKQSCFFNSIGDYLITQKKDCGIGVVTGDCLPIVVHDPITCTIAVIHAGWKGLSAGILQIVVAEMVEQIGVVPENISIYLGPAARSCCYEVQQDFMEQFCEHQEYYDAFFIKRDGKMYFDSRSFIIVIARSLGIKQEKIYTRYNVCTICNLSFCSYRREKEKARRQITMICLH